MVSHGSKLKNPINYHKGSTQAYNTLVKWIQAKVPYGVSVGKFSFSFSGKYFQGVILSDYDCRRIDLDVMKGEILKS